MSYRVAFSVLVACALLSAGCKDGSAIAAYQQYKTKTEPVIAALEKVKDDVGRNSSAKVVGDDLTAAQAAFDRWNGSLTEKERELDSARTVPVVLYAYRQVGANLGGRGPKPGLLADMNAAPAEALAKVKRMLDEGR